METVYIPDIHDDAEALRLSLKHAGCFVDEACEAIRSDVRVVLLGDLFDRGPDHAGTVKLVYSLLQQMKDRVVLLCGNHDAMRYAALLRNRPNFIKKWLLSGGITHLQQIAQEKGLQTNVEAHTFPIPEMKEMSKPEMEKWVKYVGHDNSMDLHAAWAESQRLMVQDEHVAIRNAFRLAHYNAGIFAVHAFPHEQVVRNIHEYNARFQSDIRSAFHLHLNANAMWVHQSLWGSNAQGQEVNAIDSSLAAVMREKQVGISIVGHRVQTHGPLLHEHDGLFLLSLDTGITSPHNGEKSGWCYAKHSPDGALRVACSQEGWKKERTLGYIRNCVFQEQK